MEEIDIKKAISQHLQMDSFFAGDFVLKGDLPENIEYPAQTAEDHTKNTQPQAKEANMDKAKELAKIAKEISKCSSCQIASERNKTVPGQGNPNARIVFVGEAPGADEDEQGLAFVGRAGKMLTSIIGAMGLDRSDVFICNILKCRPPGNRDPKPDEVANCKHFLHRQLEIVQPEVIVALGAHAAHTLLETNKPIGQLRGNFHEYYTSEDAQPIKFMPTYHPSYLVRNYSPDNRRRVWQDMQKILKELNLPIPKKTGK
jgi:DNA polymerase